MMQQYRDFAPSMDEVNDLGNQYDALQRGDRAFSPSKRRKSASVGVSLLIDAPVQLIESDNY